MKIGVRKAERRKIIGLLLSRESKSCREVILQCASRKSWSVVGLGQVGRRLDGWITEPSQLVGMPASGPLLHLPRVDLLLRWPEEGESIDEATTGWKEPVSRVLADPASAGKRAAEHLVAKGFPYLAMLAWGPLVEVETCRAAFAQVAAAARCRFWDHSSLGIGEKFCRGPRLWEVFLDKLVQVGQPVGVFLPSLVLGSSLLRAAQRRGLRIPEDLGVLSCGVAPFPSARSPMSLSCLDMNLPSQALAAVQQLDLRMQAHRPNIEIVTIPVRRVLVRESTGGRTGDRVFISRAHRFIFHNFHRPIQVADVAEATGLPVRSLSRRFARAIGTTVAHEIFRLRVAHVQRLLRQGRGKLRQVASLSGFSSVEHLSRCFLRVVGQSPGEYRRRHGPGGA
ncbi:MAG: helix-turn-helix domain-containing protein [Verrucomicrobia bacterium]|nr:helix-turn-helix domain-containing protein [Verrucomicrobiota bacterium]